MVIPISVVVILSAVLFYALRCKGRVKVAFHCLGTGFTIEAEEKQPAVKRGNRVEGRRALNKLGKCQNLAKAEQQTLMPPHLRRLGHQEKRATDKIKLGLVGTPEV